MLLEIDSAIGSFKGDMNYKFDHCLIKAKDTPINTSGHFILTLKNGNPDFIDAENNNYELGSGSAANNYGIGSYVLPGTTNVDIKLEPRNTTSPDLGAYERP